MNLAKKSPLLLQGRNKFAQFNVLKDMKEGSELSIKE
jgi:hypothetical protein